MLIFYKQNINYYLVMGLISFLCRSNIKVIDPHSLNPRKVSPFGRFRSTIELSDVNNSSNEVQTINKVYPEAVRLKNQLEISLISTIEAYKQELFSSCSIFKGAEKDILVIDHINPNIFSEFGDLIESNQCLAFVCFKSKTDDFLWVIRKCINNETLHSNLALGISKWNDYSGKEFQLYAGGEVRSIDDKWSLYPKTGNLSRGGFLEVRNLDENVEALAIKNGLNFIPFGLLESIEDINATNGISHDWMPSNEILEKNGLICLKKLFEIVTEGEMYEKNIKDCLRENLRIWNYEQDIIQSEHIKSWQELNLDNEFLKDCLNEILSPKTNFHACSGILKYALYEVKTNYSR